MNVAIDVGPLYGHRSGVGVAVAGLVGELERRTDVTLNPYLVSARSTPHDGHRRLPLPGIVASHLWSRVGVPSADRWLRGVDVVHGTNYVAPPSKLPTVISVYDCWFLDHPGDARPIVRRAGNQLRRAAAAGAWIHVSSEATARGARRLLATDRVVTVHLGPPPASTAPTEAPSSVAGLHGLPFIVAIGTEERRKDLPLLVEAFRLLRDTDVHLAIAGAPGDDSERLGAAIAALDDDTRRRVHRLGVVDDTSKAWLLRRSTALVYPSLDEGFGFPILEAQAAATPVVAFDVGSIPEVAGDAAVLVSDRSAAALADGITTALTGNRIALLEAGTRNLARFSWARCAEGLTDLYRTALEART